ncbi:DUF4942 domain-containing protein [Kaistia sp. MMO-174]|uniref:DUF4942 domain-containing protein n=1 Tax=Kaistia sp. MMO-174 TaxID=3081256 RepID=UPI003019C050
MGEQSYGTDIAPARRIHDMVAEYESKMASLPEAISSFLEAGSALKSAACVGGEWGDERIETGSASEHILARSLRRSAWKNVWKALRLPEIASAKDKQSFERALADPPPFDLDTVRATFWPYLENPRLTILRGLAEVFADLDPAYKSHEKVKIGVKGLPKRIILSNLGIGGWGRDRLRDILNALASYQGKPLLDYAELQLLLQDGDALKEGGTFPHPHNSPYRQDTFTVIGRGVWLRRFHNGNGHLFFGNEALRDINMALAEFYGDVLPDCHEEVDRPVPRASTAVARDLQYYPTPVAVVERVLADIYLKPGIRALEPSCGCGRFLDGLKAAGVDAIGIEVDPARAAEARAKGHAVMAANFLEVPPSGEPFDLVVMNPPFYGRHYEKHVRHAVRFLKPGGQIVAVLPATARYDHGLLDDLRPDWHDLPVGSFAESGTRVCTTVAKIRIAA